MSVIKTRTQVRPSVDVAFFKPSATIIEHVRDTFGLSVPPLMPTSSIEISPDRLTFTQTMEFVNAGAVALWEEDAQVVANEAEMAAYNAANGITASLV
jgi:hypothetical protein